MIGFFAVFSFAVVSGFAVATIFAGRLARVNFPLPSNDRRIGCIDGLRGYLAMAVMFHHFFIWVNIRRFGGPWDPPAINFLNEMGAGSVALFFMTTGLVFYPRILAGFRRTPWTTVYITRAFRILPLVILSLLIVTIIIIIKTGAVFDNRYIKASLLWISTYSEPALLGYVDSGRLNAYVLWSLRCEWIFYLFLLPACAFIADRIRGRFATYYLPLTLLVVGILTQVLAKKSGIRLDYIKYVPLFAIGMLAYECADRARVVAMFSGKSPKAIALVCLIVGMSVAQFPYGIALPFFAVFFVSVACGNGVSGVLKLKGAIILGEISFSIYTLHGIMLYLLFTDIRISSLIARDSVMIFFMPIMSVAMVIVASGTFLLIERPAVRMGKKVSRWFTGRKVKINSRELEVAP